MAQIGLLIVVTLVVLGIAYGILGMVLHARKKRHNAGFTCASVGAKDGTVHGCVCREREGSCMSVRVQWEDDGSPRAKEGA